MPDAAQPTSVASKIPKRRWLLRGASVLILALCTALSAAMEPGRDEQSLRRAAQLRGLALAEMEDANYGRAVEHLRELADILPENLLPPVNLAICYYKLNRPAEARAAIERARELDSDNPQMLYTLARILEGAQAPKGSTWRQVVDHFIAAHPRDVRPFFLLAERHAAEGRWRAATEAYDQAIRRAPENLVLLTERLVAAAESRDPQSTLDALDAIEDRLNGFEGSLLDYAQTLRDLAYNEETDALRPPALVLRNLLRPNELYQLGLLPLTGGQQAGGQMFPQMDFSPALPKSIQGGQDIALAWSDATSELDPGSLAEADHVFAIPRTERDDLLVVSGSGIARVTLEAGVQQRVELDPAPLDLMVFRDIDQDGIADLATGDASGGVLLFRGRENGTFHRGESVLDPPAANEFLVLAPLDIDHDGDLDLFVGRRSATDLYLQNNGDGSWTERAAELGLDGGDGDTYSIVSADFDDDGDLDVVTVHGEEAPRLLLNGRSGPLKDASAGWRLDDPLAAAFIDVDAADFDKDGLFDLLLRGREGVALLGNTGSRFEPVAMPAEALGSWRAATIGDFDNDGDQDVLTVFTGEPGVRLVRNRRHEFVLETTNLGEVAIDNLATGDFDSDGDLDLVAHRRGESLRFWRNEGGSRNQWLRLQLRGLTTNNSKNNSEGLFTRIEVRIADDYQALLGNGRVNHIGLGAARQADVIRVVWTNGLAQSWLQVSANRTLVEEQVLKGSCPFLYIWNGSEFEFVTDLMWRSPLGMVLPDGSAAAHESARDFVLISGEKLQPTADELWLQITEELWETVYVDRVQLLAIDHPRSVELLVDEAFRPPPYPVQPPIHWLARQLEPISARDQAGRDVLHLLRERDERYVDGLPLSRYQGLTEGHHLELAFADVPTDERLRLVLWGWIFPTDSSINLALSQNSDRDPLPPSLELKGLDGEWHTIVPFLGFPNGKRKAVVVELTDLLPSGRVDLRIPTTMQIYWDAAVMAVGEPSPDSTWHRLDPAHADLHYRGFSRLYRESESGPHLFDYQQVEVGARFRDMRGYFTRFGNVTPLLTRSDDQYAVLNAGDEITLRFDASQLPPLAQGWRRDWILFTDGWVKDGDLNTTASQTVEPLPYHGMSAYPDRPDHRYPDSQEHRAYRLRYQTREVGDEAFRSRVRASSGRR